MSQPVGRRCDARICSAGAHGAARTGLAGALMRAAHWGGLTLALLACGLAHADFSGKVVRVLDGDTLEVLVNQRPVRIRLAQVDAPEAHGQAFGARAKDTLASLAAGRVVTVIEAGQDRYARTLGTVVVDGTDVNKQMVRLGMAWAYRQYVTDPTLIKIEAEARGARHGLWVDASPVPPWEFRRQHAGEGR